MRERNNIMDIIPRPIIRAASILFENRHICLVKQVVTDVRHWALPGGKLELGERFSECIEREFREETGLDVQVRELLYMTDRITYNPFSHIVHISFLVDRLGNEALPFEWKHLDPHPSSSSDAMREIKMAPVDELEKYGFSKIYCRLIQENFPGRGCYKGDYFTFYGE
jgi:ADP-ribose pyrophosphatase YjhB (NUDIX family)